MQRQSCFSIFTSQPCLSDTETAHRGYAFLSCTPISLLTCSCGLGPSRWATAGTPSGDGSASGSGRRISRRHSVTQTNHEHLTRIGDADCKDAQRRRRARQECRCCQALLGCTRLERGPCASRASSTRPSFRVVWRALWAVRLGLIAPTAGRLGRLGRSASLSCMESLPGASESASVSLSPTPHPHRDILCLTAVWS